VIGGGDWGESRLVPDLMRAALDRRPIVIRNPHAVRPWQHVLNPLSGYLNLAQGLWSSADYAGAWNFGPSDSDDVTVAEIVRRVADLWPDGLEWTIDDGLNVHEAGYLRLDSSKAREQLGWHPPLGLHAALGATVDWYLGLRAKADMRAATVGQIEAVCSRPASSASAR
jgi:CDP-glucose 4,6-dehydratase